MTVIAVALVAIFFRLSDANPISSVHAAAAPIPAPIPAPAPHERQVIDVNLVQVNGMNLYQRWVNLKDGNKAGYIPISLESVDETTSTFNVNIKDIDDKFTTNNFYKPNTKSLYVNVVE